MSTETKAPKVDATYIEDFSSRRSEPTWLLDLRKKALEEMEVLPLPKAEKTRIIGWNFTFFVPESSGEAVATIESLPERVQQLIGKGEQSGNLLVHHNEKGVLASLSDELKSKGVILTDIQTAAREHGELLQNYFFGKACDYKANKLTALNAALGNAGTFIYVPKNVVIDVPLQSVYWQEDPSVGLINHVIIIAESGSSVTYVENYLSEDTEDSGVANTIAEVYVGDNARVQYGAVDNLSKNVTTYVNRRAYVGRDGKIEWALGQMNDGNIISETYTALVGDGSVGDTKAVSVGRGNQHQNFTNYIQHFGKNSESNLLIHGVQREGANAIFNGITKIEHGGTKSNGDQTQRVLMLSDKARGDANPILLIDEDDVIAGHAASVGRIDPVQLYYLMSRGIKKEDAERLVIHGFLAPVVTQLPVEGVKAQLIEVIEGKVK
ncbi:Fe-S cluster assembly protein SufD [Pullulanibacillus sp. KACC 23026]|uniref:Fe-S cluster assembly protein SufD n=1 Tax=Pullulanibacillus sp. KACC 23026 TaxID=3028315 RepID=UPI0023AEDD3A|nr:Fe-S cluster assembly protein SufD [Pullulanibacillus sp. KACC 23026]WEG13765.1 Fe-S cluster assembly protein SufD [Pullulanibacillus sp. KACC 23026]